MTPTPLPMDPSGASMPGAGTGCGPQILIVDDNQANLDLLEGLLEVAGYQSRLAKSGEQALQAAREHRPDAVLLDIQMPGMGGFKTCEAFRAESALASIPILFLSALSDAPEKVKAFQVGGNDYITKPFQAAEVMARVAHHIRTAQLEAMLTRRNAELQAAATQIQELDLVRSNITAMLVHDLRSPLTGARMALDMVALGKESFEEMYPRAQESLERMGKLLTEMLELARSQGMGFHLALQPLHPRPLLEEVVRLAEAQAMGARVSFRAELPAHIPPIAADASKLDRALLNLLGNAFKYTPPGGSVLFNVDVVEGEGVDAGTQWLRIRVTDSGAGISADLLPFIFDPFRQVKSTTADQGVGLGLAIVQRIIAGHRGRILAQSQVGVGTTFIVTLPLAPD